jgi:spore coat polysaccharide biosynthesis protein SpsF (cytidylyltransferase family)
MSSKRFPGKVLAPFNGIPILTRVIGRVSKVISSGRIVVLTSTNQSDDPLVCYMLDAGISVYRGPLENVFERFQLCLREYPCSWFFRICADSPLIDNEILKTMLIRNDKLDVDLITNVFPRTFPKGQSVEMLNADTFSGIDPYSLNLGQQEHVTKVYYENPESYRIINVESSERNLAAINLSVDTIEDLYRLQFFDLE